MFESIPFEDVIEFLREKGEINIWVNWKALEAAGIERDAEVTTKLKDIRLGKVISMLLYDVGGGDVPLAHAFRDNVLIISTKDDLRRETAIRIYDIRPLVGRRGLSVQTVGRIADAVLDVAVHRGIVLAPRGYEYEGCLCGECTHGESLLEAATAKGSNELLDSLRQSVETDQWLLAGGSVGTARELAGFLVVRHNAAAHAQVLELLQGILELRRAYGLVPPVPQSPPVERHVVAGRAMPRRTLPADGPYLGRRRTIRQPDVGEADRQARQWLLQRVPEVRFDNADFQNVTEFLRDLQGMGWSIRWAAMQDAGIQPDTKITIKLKDVRFDIALDLILQEAGAGGVPLGYATIDGQLVLSTRDDLNRRTVTRTYDIRPLVEAMVRLSEPVKRAVAASIRRLSHHPPPSTQPATGLSILGADEKEALLRQAVDDALRHATARSLLNTIRLNVDVLSWRQTGGAVGYLQELDGVLVVAQTPTAQDQVAWLLQTLLDALTGQPPRPTGQSDLADGRGRVPDSPPPSPPAGRAAPRRVPPSPYLAPVPASQPTRAAGLSFQAGRVVFLVDRSGSMLEVFDHVRAMLLRDIAALDAGQEMNVLFFSTGRPVALGPRPVRADDAVKAECRTFVERIVPAGRSDPLPGVEQALPMRPDAIVMLTDGEFDKKLLDEVTRLDPDRRTRFYTVAVLYNTGAALLKELAARTGGKYRFVSAQELGVPAPEPPTTQAGKR